MQTSTH